MQSGEGTARQNGSNHLQAVGVVQPQYVIRVRIQPQPSRNREPIDLIRDQRSRRLPAWPAGSVPLRLRIRITTGSGDTTAPLTDFISKPMRDNP